MSESLVTSATTVIMAIVGVAIIALLVSRQANTSGVISSGAAGFSQSLGAALSPVVGGNGLFAAGFAGNTGGAL